MANLTVRNLPDKTKEALRIQATSNQQESKPLNILVLAEQYFGPDQGVELELPLRGSNRPVVDFD
jgi:hypothetical protein